MKRTLTFVAIALLGLATASRTPAQNPALGTWKMNPAKSKYNLGSVPKSMTRTVASEGDKVKYTFEGVEADGSPISYTFTVAYDGKDYPITGAAPAGADTISFKQYNEATVKKAGQPVLISKVKVSADGKVTTIQTSAAGTGSINSTVVYERQ